MRPLSPSLRSAARSCCAGVPAGGPQGGTECATHHNLTPPRGVSRLLMTSRSGTCSGSDLPRRGRESRSIMMPYGTDGMWLSSEFSGRPPAEETALTMPVAELAPRDARNPLRVLVIEDNRDAADSLHMLRRRPTSCWSPSAATGPRTIAAAPTRAASTTFSPSLPTPMTCFGLSTRQPCDRGIRKAEAQTGRKLPMKTQGPGTILPEGVHSHFGTTTPSPGSATCRSQFQIPPPSFRSPQVVATHDTGLERAGGVSAEFADLGRMVREDTSGQGIGGILQRVEQALA
jgi:hypothetical protein